MRNVKITVEYVGTNYKGWQRQKNTPRTVQETIERTLARILKERIRLIASGRTDVGVHGLGQVANFKNKSGIPLANLKQALNSLLPDDVAIIKAEEVAPDFHSRFDAKSKIYRYIILNQKYPSAFWRGFAYLVPYKLDVKAMQRAAQLLLGRRDFRSFQASDTRFGGSVRRINRIKIYRADYFIPHLPPFPGNIAVKKGAAFVYFDIEADGFLYKMVRNIAGTLIEIGKGRKSPSGIKETLALKNRKFAGPTAPGHGLYLLRVKY
ncbi:MAG: tRNA pseudouridine(38-40) synthase TruA [Candidatus Omnitrophota bacterium]